MAFELIYTGTGSKGGIRPNSRGYCTVAHTRGMPVNYVELEENLCRYKSIFGVEDANYLKNPVAFQHFHLKVGGQLLWHLSRTGVCGDSVTGRNNYISHCLILTEAEVSILKAGPAAVLLCERGSLHISEWSKSPELFPEQRRVGTLTSETIPRLRTWRKLAGDAGWGGLLAEGMLPSSTPRVILYDPLTHSGEDLLSLINEAISLLPPEKRWEATFSTYLRGAPPMLVQDGCLWRFCPKDYANEARRAAPQAPIIDLTKPETCLKDSDVVICAREGRLPDWSKLLASHMSAVSLPPTGIAANEPKRVVSTAPSLRVSSASLVPELTEFDADTHVKKNVAIGLAAIAILVIFSLSWIVLSAGKQRDSLAAISQRQDESRRQHTAEELSLDKKDIPAPGPPTAIDPSNEGTPIADQGGSLAPEVGSAVAPRDDSLTPTLQFGAIISEINGRKFTLTELLRPNDIAISEDEPSLSAYISAVDLRECNLHFFRNGEMIAFNQQRAVNSITFTERGDGDITKIMVTETAFQLDLGEWPDYIVIPLKNDDDVGPRRELVVFLPLRLEIPAEKITTGDLPILLSSEESMPIQVPTLVLTGKIPASQDLGGVFIESLIGPGNASFRIRFLGGPEGSATSQYFEIPFTAQLDKNGEALELKLLPTQSPEVRNLLTKLEAHLTKGSISHFVKLASEGKAKKIVDQVKRVEDLLLRHPPPWYKPGRHLSNLRNHPDFVQEIESGEKMIAEQAQAAVEAYTNTIRQLEKERDGHELWQELGIDQHTKELLLALAHLRGNSLREAQHGLLQQIRQRQIELNQDSLKLVEKHRELERRRQQALSDREKLSREQGCDRYANEKSEIRAKNTELAKLGNNENQKGKRTQLKTQIDEHERRIRRILRERSQAEYENTFFKAYLEAEKTIADCDNGINDARKKNGETNARLANLQSGYENRSELVNILKAIEGNRQGKSIVIEQKNAMTAALNELALAIEESIGENQTAEAKSRLFDIRLEELHFQKLGISPRLLVHLSHERTNREGVD